jgi:hypothetical protein
MGVLACVDTLVIHGAVAFRRRPPGRSFCSILVIDETSSNRLLAKGATMWQFANHVLEKTDRYSLNEWLLIGACAVFVSFVYLLTKQR